LFLGCSEIKTSYHPHLKRCGLISDIKKAGLKVGDKLEAEASNNKIVLRKKNKR